MDKNCSTGSGGMKCCWKTVFGGALIGALAMFVYITASWMVLPWHKTSLMTFKNENVVASVIEKNAEKSGVYVMPNKPLSFISIYHEGLESKTKRLLVKEFWFCALAAAVLTKLLKCSCGCPVAYSMKAGLLVAIMHYIPNMIWYHFPLNYSLMGMADDVLSLTVAGWAISKFILGSGNCTMGKGGGKKA